MANLTIIASEVLRNGCNILAPRLAGGAIAAGDCLYVDSAGLYQLARSDATAAEAAAVGMALNSAGINAPVTAATTHLLILGSSSGASAGTPYCVSATPGKLIAWAELGSGAWVTNVGTGAALLIAGSGAFDASAFDPAAFDTGGGAAALLLAILVTGKQKA